MVQLLHRFISSTCQSKQLHFQSLFEHMPFPIVQASPNTILPASILGPHAGSEEIHLHISWGDLARHEVNATARHASIGNYLNH